jgi:hypothetical protein
MSTSGKWPNGKLPDHGSVAYRAEYLPLSTSSYPYRFETKVDFGAERSAARSVVAAELPATKATATTAVATAAVAGVREINNAGM